MKAKGIAAIVASALGFALMAALVRLADDYGEPLSAFQKSFFRNLVHGHSWRTTGDVFDVWASVAESIEAQKRLFPYSRPGAFNDPDML